MALPGQAQQMVGEDVLEKLQRIKYTDKKKWAFLQRVYIARKAIQYDIN